MLCLPYSLSSRFQRDSGGGGREVSALIMPSLPPIKSPASALQMLQSPGGWDRDADI